MTAPELFAMAIGEPRDAGDQRCFYCGAACGQSFPTSAYVKPSFTGLNTVAAPASKWVCRGCVLAMNEQMTLAGHEKAQKVRNYSWLITTRELRFFSKGSLDELRYACLSPPDPPFAIALAVSGQKHIVYRTPVNVDREVITLQLEEQPVTYRAAELAQRLELCKRIAAATGKPALAERPGHALAMRLAAYYEDWETTFAAWERVCGQPLSALAAHLCPRKESCADDYPSTNAPRAAGPRRRGVPAQAGGPDGCGLFD